MQHITKSLIQLALIEDLGPGDITSKATIDPKLLGAAVIRAKESLVVCGQEVVSLVFSEIDSSICYEALKKDGARVDAGTVIGRVSGPVGSLLSAERTALNFFQRLSGVATVTAEVMVRVADLPVRILDTRKTTPGWRELEKYAVKTGGGTNHRFGLFDAVLIKNNHVDALGGDIGRAVRRCREDAPRGTKIEVEVRNSAELQAAFAERPDAMLLDNMPLAELAQCVSWVRAQDGGEKVELEASGGITMDNVRQYAASGVDAISLGFLTHSARAVDISLGYTEKS